MKGTPNLNNFAYGSYVDRLLGLANETFSTLHRQVFQPLWSDNRIMAKLRHNPCTTDWGKGKYEIHIPTRDSADYNLSFSRIAIQVLPEIDNETARKEAIILMNPMRPPQGDFNSELLILIAPKLKSRGFIRGFRHVNKRGFLTAVFVNKSPEIVWKRILCLLINFFNRRISAFMESLGFQSYEWDRKDRRTLYYICDNILERFGYVLRLSAKTFLKLLEVFTDKLKAILHEIGMQNMVKKAVQSLEGMRKGDQLDVLNRLKAAILGESGNGMVQVFRNRNSAGDSGQQDRLCSEMRVLLKAVPLESSKDRASVKWRGR